ncbi:flagellar protein FlaG [Brevundimonas goettingensis]|uniref:Flagellar protein FlaG n=1 Tax=Brevundimonas goettingensis TaxID=2774190 RepID=A0A975C277_9CAUL|nr:flagellar protein FlaG [Brevundimonas goettingensis]QTC89991.1 flagellar protein FlaG [Brevundimonas goettingensis]
METNAKLSLVIPAPAVTPAATTGDESPVTKSSSEVEQAAQYRLVIEEGPTIGSFIYKTMDSATGEIVRQFPREQVIRMAEAKKYDAGSVFDTTA